MWSELLLSLPEASRPDRIERILIVRTDRLGDVILTLPLLPTLRKCFPDAHISMLLRRYTGEIMEGNPYVNELLWYDSGEGLIPFSAMRRAIREQHFDAVIVVYPTLRLAWLMFRTGIPLRIGTGFRYYSFLFNSKVYEHRKDAKRHELEYNFSLLNALGCTANGQPEFHIHIPDDADKKVEQLLQSLGITSKNEIIIIHPGSGGSAREWGGENFGMLAAKLLAREGTRVLVTGGRGEERKVAEVLIATKGLAIPLVGQLNIKELAALIRSSNLFVSNSTGPMHLAAALGVPVVGLFPQITAMSPKRWGPYTGKKRVLTPDKPIDCKDCLGKQGVPCTCMASITVEQVFNAACDLLQEQRVRDKGTLIHG